MLVVDGREVAPVEVARSRKERRVGLLGRSGCEGGLWLPRVRSVHTVGMRFAIDVAWVAPTGWVQRVRRMPPGRISRFVPAAAGVLEAEAGRFAEWGLGPGSTVDLSRFERPVRGGNHGTRESEPRR